MPYVMELIMGWNQSEKILACLERNVIWWPGQGSKWWFMVWLFSSVTQSCPTLCDPMGCSTPASLSITNSWSLLKLMSVELVMPSNHLILCHPLRLLPSVSPSIRVFSNMSALHIRWSEYSLDSCSLSAPGYKCKYCSLGTGAQWQARPAFKRCTVQWMAL